MITNLQTILTIAQVIFVLLFFGIVVGFSFLRGLPRSRIRGICRIVNLLLSLGLVFIVKASQFTEKIVANIEIPTEEVNTDLISALIADGSIVNFLEALIAPILFFWFFIILEILTAIVCAIVFAAIGEPMKRQNCTAPAKGIRTAAWGLSSALVILVVLVAPISAYAGYTRTIAKSIPEDPSYSETVEVVENSASAVDESILLKAHHSLFGWVDNSLASFRVGDKKTNVKTELPILASVAEDALTVVNNEKDITSSDSIDAIQRIIDNMKKSPLLTSVVGTVTHELTKEYMEQYKDDPDNAVLYTILSILHEDSKDPEKFSADIQTLSEALAEYNKSGGEFNSEKFDALLAVLEKNANLAPLLTKVKELAYEAIREELRFGKDEFGEYSELVEEAIEELNEISSLPPEQQRETVTRRTRELLEETTFAATDERVEYFTDVIINDLLPKDGGSLTPESVEDFIAHYATDHYSELREQGLI